MNNILPGDEITEIRNKIRVHCPNVADMACNFINKDIQELREHLPKCISKCLFCHHEYLTSLQIFHEEICEKKRDKELFEEDLLRRN